MTGITTAQFKAMFLANATGNTKVLAQWSDADIAAFLGEVDDLFEAIADVSYDSSKKPHVAAYKGLVRHCFREVMSDLNAKGQSTYDTKAGTVTSFVNRIPPMVRFLFAKVY